MNHDVNDVNKKMYQLQLSSKIALLQQRLLGVNIVKKKVCFIPSKVFNAKRNRRNDQRKPICSRRKQNAIIFSLDASEVCNIYYAFSC